MLSNKACGFCIVKYCKSVHSSPISRISQNLLGISLNHFHKIFLKPEYFQFVKYLIQLDELKLSSRLIIDLWGVSLDLEETTKLSTNGRNISTRKFFATVASAVLRLEVCFEVRCCASKINLWFLVVFLRGYIQSWNSCSAFCLDYVSSKTASFSMQTTSRFLDCFVIVYSKKTVYS